MYDSYISVPVRTDLFVNLVAFLHDAGRADDPVDAIEAAIRALIETGEGLPPEPLPPAPAETPPPGRGYVWKSVFLPHGTQLRMKYRGQIHYAVVQGDRLLFQDRPVSPSELARSIAGSNRNAWRDLWVMLPGADRWVLADSLRRATRAIAD
ncbi:MAG TPA: hypothetical protein VF274_05175 [Alphaproteobacteria bacterium]|jgi:hypothetical protein